jgi:hypothetical protein
MNKVTISFWFRIPRESAAKVRERDVAAPGTDFSILLSVVPLLLFGQQPSSTVYDFENGVIGYIPAILPDGTPAPVPIFGTFIVGNHQALQQPSCIGVQFDDNLEGRLQLHIQTSDHATGANLKVETPSATWDPGWNPANPDDEINYHYVDASYTETARLEYLGNIDAGADAMVQDGLKVTVDQWHHLLISWDLMSGNVTHGSMDGGTTVTGTEAYSTMWCALDDVNKDKENLPAKWIGGYGYGSEPAEDANPNAMLCRTAHFYAGHPGPVSPIFSAPPAVSVTFSAIPSDPLIVPAPVQINRDTGPVDANQVVEMAELQIFTGVTLDTGIESNRRAFIDYNRDQNGNIIKDDNGKATLIPVDPTSAEELLKKKPEILLHGSDKWIDGENTGTTGFDYAVDPPQKIPEGQFQPTGNIAAYTPDPSLQPET